MFIVHYTLLELASVAIVYCFISKCEKCLRIKRFLRLKSCVQAWINLYRKKIRSIWVKQLILLLPNDRLWRHSFFAKLFLLFSLPFDFSEMRDFVLFIFGLHCWRFSIFYLCRNCVWNHMASTLAQLLFQVYPSG